jgi:hypothetical protein
MEEKGVVVVVKNKGGFFMDDGAVGGLWRGNRGAEKNPRRGAVSARLRLVPAQAPQVGCEIVDPLSSSCR